MLAYLSDAMHLRCASGEIIRYTGGSVSLVLPHQWSGHHAHACDDKWDLDLFYDVSELQLSHF